MESMRYPETHVHKVQPTVGISYLNKFLIELRLNRNIEVPDSFDERRAHLVSLKGEKAITRRTVA